MCLLSVFLKTIDLLLAKEFISLNNKIKWLKFMFTLSLLKDEM